MKDEEETVENVKCPFCGEDGFDLEGLKAHLYHQDCEEYAATEILDRVF